MDGPKLIYTYVTNLFIKIVMLNFYLKQRRCRSFNIHEWESPANPEGNTLYFYLLNINEVYNFREPASLLSPNEH